MQVVKCVLPSPQSIEKKSPASAGLFHGRTEGLL